MSAASSSHPLAEPFAAALFGAESPDPLDFLMLLNEIAQLSPIEYAVMWTQTVEIGRGEPATPRERAQWALSAPSRVVEALRLATLLGEAAPSVQALVVKTLRLSIRRQMGAVPGAVSTATTATMNEGTRTRG